MEAHLSNAFLDRVKAAYRRAIAATSPTRGLWAAHDERRADVHAALLAGDNGALRAIFADPTITDLYYGVDRLCRSAIRLNDPSDFISEALHKDDPRAACAIYQIKRLQELDPAVRTVVEIGPGMGRAASHGHLAGMDYTTIDLSLGIVGQACFLGRALGPDALWFAGENNLPSDGRIKLLHRSPDRRFDFALNVDSITEMPAAIAFDYFRWAAEHVRFLLSIFHCKNLFTVAQLSAPNKIVTRRPCVVWDGYMEETFLLDGRRMISRRLRLAAFEAFVFSARVRRGVARRWRTFKQFASCN